MIVRMPVLFRNILQQAAEREGMSVNAVVLTLLGDFFLDELKALSAEEQEQLATTA